MSEDFEGICSILREWVGILREFVSILRECVRILREFVGILREFVTILIEFVSLLREFVSILREFVRILREFVRMREFVSFRRIVFVKLLKQSEMIVRAISVSGRVHSLQRRGICSHIGLTFLPIKMCQKIMST
jgi:hypothetical protein